MRVNLLGLELEGLSNEDREFEVARQFVWFGNDAVQRTVQAGDSARDARSAYMDAARQHASGYTTPDRFASGSSAGSRLNQPIHWRTLRHEGVGCAVAAP